MDVSVIVVPNVMELSLYNNEKKEKILVNMYDRYVEKIAELALYAPDDVVEVAKDNAKVIEIELVNQDYLSLFPWELHKLYQKVRASYDGLIITIGRYKKFTEEQERYRSQVKEKIDIIAGLEDYIKNQKEIAKHFEGGCQSYITKIVTLFLIRNIVTIHGRRL